MLEMLDVSFTGDSRMSFFADSKFVWKNGQIIPWADATIHMSAHGLHYGTGVFEGIRCYNMVHGPAVFRLDAHLQRMFESAKMYGLPIPYSQEELTQGGPGGLNRHGLHTS